MNAPVEKCAVRTHRSCEVDLKSEEPRIIFRPCGYVSTKPIDIETKYCRLCQTFLENELNVPFYD